MFAASWSLKTAVHIGASTLTACAIARSTTAEPQRFRRQHWARAADASTTALGDRPRGTHNTRRASTTPRELRIAGRRRGPLRGREVASRRVRRARGAANGSKAEARILATLRDDVDERRFAALDDRECARRLRDRDRRAN